MDGSLIDKEPTWLINGIESVLAFAASLGFQVTTQQHDNIILIAGVLFAVGNLLFAWYQRSKVYAPATVQSIANNSAATGSTDIGTPPAGPTVLTEADAAADVAGTPRPDNPTVPAPKA